MVYDPGFNLSVCFISVLFVPNLCRVAGEAIIELSVSLSEGEAIMPDDIQIQAAQEGGNIFDQELTMEAYNVKILAHFLKQYNKNAIQVANKLDISRATVYRMISKYDL